jgi:curved DNA-binding protein CbpA
MNHLEKYYRALGLEPGASLDEVNQAYKDLAFIWHPDRVPKDNERLQQKAQEKLKEINQARDQLRSVKSSAYTKKPQSPPAHSPAPSRYYQKPPQSSYQSASQSSYQKPPQSSYQKPPQSQSSYQSAWQSSINQSDHLQLQI